MCQIVIVPANTACHGSLGRLYLKGEAFAEVFRQAEQGFVSDDSSAVYLRCLALGIFIPSAFHTVFKPKGRLQHGGGRLGQCESMGKVMRPSSSKVQCLPPAIVVNSIAPSLHARHWSLIFLTCQNQFREFLCLV